jgi:hypothetical protein
MSDVLTMYKNIEDQMFAKYGDPIAKVKGNRALDTERIHFTYYVSRLMEERGHDWVGPRNITCEHVDRAYYSELALFDAFEAGMLIARGDAAKMREQIRQEVKAELMSALEDM